MSSPKHLTIEQARALRAKYPAWPRWTELETGDWVLHPLRGISIVHGSYECDGRLWVQSVAANQPNTDDTGRLFAAWSDTCQLLPTVADLLDLAARVGVVSMEYDGLGGWLANLNCAAAPEADTPLAALYAALMGGE